MPYPSDQIDVVSAVTLTSLGREVGGNEIINQSVGGPDALFEDGCDLSMVERSLLGGDERPLQGAVRSHPVFIMITSRGSPRTSIVERVCRLLADGSGQDRPSSSSCSSWCSEHRGRLQLVSPKYVLDVALATPTDLRTPLQRWAIEELHRGASLGMKVD